MNSKIFLLALLSLLVTFSACDKKEVVDEYAPIIPAPRIKTITHWNTVVDSYEYDQLGRITKMDRSANTYGSNLNVRYSYISDTLIVITSTSQFRTIIDSLVLNDQGYLKTLIKMNIIAHEDGEFTDTSYISNYEYDSNGYNIKISNSDGIIFMETENGNTVKNTKEDVNIFTYQFFSTKANTIGNENMGKAWMGKQNKNLLAKVIDSRMYNGLTRETIYSYKFDKHKRVVQQSVSSGSYTETTSYTYYD